MYSISRAKGKGWGVPPAGSAPGSYTFKWACQKRKVVHNMAYGMLLAMISTVSLHFH